MKKILKGARKIVTRVAETVVSLVKYFNRAANLYEVYKDGKLAWCETPNGKCIELDEVWDDVKPLLHFTEQEAQQDIASAEQQKTDLPSGNIV